jgi:hypothetical protein
LWRSHGNKKFLLSESPYCKGEKYCVENGVYLSGRAEPSMCKAMSLIPSFAHNNKQNQKKTSKIMHMKFILVLYDRHMPLI